MANLSKLTHLDPQTTGQPGPEPEHSLQHGCLMQRSQQRRIASRWCLCQRMSSWFTVFPYIPLIFETQMPPCSRCKEESLQLCLPEGRLSLTGAVSELTALFIFCRCFRGFLYQLLWDSLKLMPDEMPESPETTPFWRVIHPLQLLIITYLVPIKILAVWGFAWGGQKVFLSEWCIRSLFYS